MGFSFLIRRIGWVGSHDQDGRPDPFLGRLRPPHSRSGGDPRPWYAEEILAVALSLMTRANPLLLKSGRYFVAETEERKIVGCGGWSPERPGSGETEHRLGHVRHFATHPDRIRKGIGRALLTHSIESARAEGVVRLECNSSLAAERFYRTLGFETVGPVEVDMGHGVKFPGIIMRMDL